MQIMEASVDQGIIKGKLLIQYEDIIMAGSQAQAVQEGILQLSEHLGISDVNYASVTEMTEQGDDLEICVEAALTPVVVLGQYKGLKIHIGHNEDFDQAALNAAVANITVDLPDMIIQRQLDSVESEAQAQVLQSSSLHTLADIHVIISRLFRQCKRDCSEDELWKIAMTASESYIAKCAQDVDIMVASIREICDAPEESIFRNIVTRAQERAKLSAEEIAAQVFDAYLHTQGIDIAQWRMQNRDLAVQRCRQDLMLKAVIREEGITANDIEVQRAAYEIANGYDMNVQEFLNLVGEDGIRAQLCQQKAIKLITESARGLA